jgi:hypothetical protein
LIFLVALGAFLVAGLPLSTALGMLEARERGLDYESASGTVWRGSIHGARLANQDVGEVDVALSSAGLARGVAELQFQSRGALRARGVLSAGLGGAVELSDATLVADARDLGRLHPDLAARGGEFFVRLDEAAFDLRGGCARASGVVQSDVLARGGGSTGWRGPALEGAISCTDGSLTVALSGAEEGTAVSIDAMLNARSGTRVFADVSTENPEVAAALAYLGFVENESGFSYAYQSRQDTAS